MPEKKQDKMADIAALWETLPSLMEVGADEAVVHEEARMNRLNAMISRLDPKHPRVAGLTQRRDRAVARGEGLKRELERLSKHPRKPEAWTVAGRVRDPDGKPFKNLSVKLVAKEAKLNRRLKDSKTDAHGDFVLAYTDADLGDHINTARELALTVKKGNTVLYTSPATLAYAPWSTDYFELSVPLSSRSDSPKAPGPKPPGLKPPGRRNPS